MAIKSVILATLLTAPVSAWLIPQNVQAFYNKVKKGGCHSFASGKSNLNDGQGNSGFGFCIDTANVVYLSGRNSLGDMDIDCDGAQNCGGLSGDFQGETAFDDTLRSKGYGIKTLDASIHQFSVLGTCHVNLEGIINPLALVAVVCNNQLLYSVWGDTNGCDNNDVTGEASISLAQLCFPNEGLDGNNGHEAHDVLYLAFTGSDAVVGPRNAKWKAKTALEFQSSLKAFGDSVLNKKFGGTMSPSNPGGGCSWAGHCVGAKCRTCKDCGSGLQCRNGICSSKPPPVCSWAGHCTGATCRSENDCSDSLVCKSGKCAV
ncbi:hypothetical protein DRE_06927 [Drechslerella stenobrocha 248]|uniref:Endo-chitosanase n=1 Tax=Drechslerella stenobrocha 248 TaxID=1043628 RepID=W7HVU5_9PEZI|nr:hypothetical protein DRE_06927 [Drechslerella stenobrocha 248]